MLFHPAGVADHPLSGRFLLVEPLLVALPLHANRISSRLSLEQLRLELVGEIVVVGRVFVLEVHGSRHLDGHRRGHPSPDSRAAGRFVAMFPNTALGADVTSSSISYAGIERRQPICIWFPG